MKKIICMVAIILLSGLLLTSCNQEVQFGGLVEICWKDFDSVDKLIEDSDAIAIARVTDISFLAVDCVNQSEITDTTDNTRIGIATEIHLNVISKYLGEIPEKLIIRIYTGYPYYQPEEQLKILKKAKKGNDLVIPIWSDHEMEELRCEIGKTYLFVMDQWSNGSWSILTPMHSIYSLDEPTRKKNFEDDIMFSAKDIIMEFGEDKWNDFYARWEKGEFEPIPQTES